MVGGGWQQPPCPVSPAPPHLPVGEGEASYQPWPAAGDCGEGSCHGLLETALQEPSTLSVRAFPSKARTLGREAREMCQYTNACSCNTQTQCIEIVVLIYTGAPPSYSCQPTLQVTKLRLTGVERSDLPKVSRPGVQPLQVTQLSTVRVGRDPGVLTSVPAAGPPCLHAHTVVPRPSTPGIPDCLVVPL